MKSKILMSLLIFAIGSFANENELSNESGKQEAEIMHQGASVSPKEKADPIAYFASKVHALDSGKRIIFLKNPCFGVRGYRMQTARGFSFENGIVKKFGGNGTMTEVKGIHPSLAHYLRSKNICQAINKKIPASRVNMYSAEIWQ